MSEAADSRGEFVKAGYLVKSPPLSRAYVSQWHRRWFLLMDSKLVYPLAQRYVRLVYYQSEADAKRLADPKGSINLNTCLSVMSSSVPVKNFKFVFNVSTTERVYHLAADSDEERCEWVSILKDLLFPSKDKSGPPPPPVPAPRKSPEVVRRIKDSSRVQRPASLCSAINFGESRAQVSPGVQRRPLPPVPSSGNTTPPSPMDRKNRPLPAPPAPTSSGVYINPVGPQTSPLVKKRVSVPPPKPEPYRKNKSVPSPPPPALLPSQCRRSSSLSPPPSVHVEDYQQFVTQNFVQSQLEDDHYEFGVNTKEDNYSLATSVPRQEAVQSRPILSTAAPPEGNADDYSVLESSTISGYDPTNQDYSHLEVDNVESPPPPIRYSSLAPHHVTDPAPVPPVPRTRQRPHSAIPDYVNYPSPSSPTKTNEDYSVLQH